MNAIAATALFELRLLGGFELTDPAGHPVTISSRKAQVLIAYLAQRAGQAVSRKKLGAMLWGGTSETEALHSLRQCLLILRKAVGDLDELVTIEQESIRFRQERAAVDIRRFERLVDEGTAEALREAAAVYRGEFLEGVRLPGEAIDDWLVFERRRLAHLVKKGLLPLLEATESAGRVDDAAEIATRLLAIDPQQQDVQSTLVRLYGGPKVAPSGLAGRTILLGDASENDRRGLAEELRGRGHDVVECADAAELLIEAGAHDPDAVVVDLSLPGVETAAIVRAMAARRPRTPVLCTGPGSQEEREAEGLAAGAADFLRKPLDVEVLLLRIDNAIRLRNPRTNGASG